MFELIHSLHGKVSFIRATQWQHAVSSGMRKLKPVAEWFKPDLPDEAKIHQGKSGLWLERNRKPLALGRGNISI